MRLWLKIIIVIAVVVLIGGAVYAAWQFFIKPVEPTEPGQSPAGGNNRPPAGEVILRKISDQPVFDFWAVSDTKSVFYFGQDGKVFLANIGADLIQSNQTVNALNRAEISPNQQKILTSFGDPRQPQWGIYDLIDKIWRPLPADIVNAAWLANAENLIAINRTSSGEDLAIIDLKKNPPVYKTIIKNFALRDIVLKTVLPNKILISEKPTGLLPTRIWQLDLKSLNLTPLLSPQLGTVLGFSPANSLIFKFSAPANFSILNSSFEEFEPLNFATLPEKCAPAPNAIYCFTPKDDFPANEVMPDAYFQNRIQTVDSLISFEFSTSTRTFSQFASPWTSVADDPVDAGRPQYLDGKIYFINRYDNFLYELTF